MDYTKLTKIVDGAGSTDKYAQEIINLAKQGLPNDYHGDAMQSFDIHWEGIKQMGDFVDDCLLQVYPIEEGPNYGRIYVVAYFAPGADDYHNSDFSWDEFDNNQKAEIVEAFKASLSSPSSSKVSDKPSNMESSNTETLDCDYYNASVYSKDAWCNFDQGAFDSLKEAKAWVKKMESKGYKLVSITAVWSDRNDNIVKSKVIEKGPIQVKVSNGND